MTQELKMLEPCHTANDTALMVCSLLAKNENNKGFCSNPDLGAFALLTNAIDCGLITELDAVAIIKENNIYFPERHHHPTSWNVWTDKYFP